MWLQTAWIHDWGGGLGHEVGPVGATRWSFGACVGVRGRGGAAEFGGGFLLPGGRSSLTERRRHNSCRLETPAGLHDGVDH